MSGVIRAAGAGRDAALERMRAAVGHAAALRKLERVSVSPARSGRGLCKDE